MRDLAAYYDRLSLWTAVARAFGYGGGRGTLTVHRALADPRADGRPTATRVHDLLADALPPLTEPRVLDAGCGLGGTMIDLATRVGGTYVGLTLSEKQAAIGRRAAERAGHGRAIQFQVESYDTPPPGPFDLVVAIESLAHSSNPEQTVRRLSASLAVNGVFAVVDDMPEPAAAGNANHLQDLATFKSGWGCPVLWDAEQYRAQFANLGLRVFADLESQPSRRAAHVEWHPPARTAEPCSAPRDPVRLVAHPDGLVPRRPRSRATVSAPRDELSDDSRGG